MAKQIDKAAAADPRKVARLLLLRHELTLRLNPNDPNDREILECVKQMATSNDGDKRQEFVDRVALLLKHDWERAKYEANGDIVDSNRLSYKEWQKEISTTGSPSQR